MRVITVLLAVGGCAPSDVLGWMDHHEVPGASVAVFRGFELKHANGYGVKDHLGGDAVTEETLFQAASLTKSVTAAAVLTLVSEGLVDLDTDVNEYLTSWRVPDSSVSATEKVTLRRLLSHTAGTTVSGFRGYRYTERRPNLVQILDGEPPANSPAVRVTQTPGVAFRYSGGGYVIVQLVIEDVTGEAFSDFVWRRVLEPAGMTASTMEQPIHKSLRDALPTGHYANGRPVSGGHHIYVEAAAGGLWTTASDLGRFLIEVQLAARGESNAVLSQGYAEILLTEVMHNYSLGLNLWRRGGERYIGHPGANDGFRSKMMAHRSAGVAAVVLTNSDRGLDMAEDVIEMIGNRENWPGY